MRKLAGVLFTYNALKMDYCFMEAVHSLLEFCDHVFVFDAGSNDGTLQMLFDIQSQRLTIKATKIWNDYSGKEKLSHFTNLAIEMAEKSGYDYVFSLQADEIVHEKSYAAILKLVDEGWDGYLVKRVNLWGSPYTYLNVPENRQPCSTKVIRLAKSNYRAVDDAESLGVYAVDRSNEVVIYHMGFVRDKKVMVDKVKYMQADVFGVTPDEKLKGMEEFNPWAWFNKNEVSVIEERLPKIIQKWAKKRK